jgi:prepilin-type N-terminal cleavage/methylation domain-containing protein
MIEYRKGKPRRNGFTLIELLVVIGIITILMALTAAGALKVMAEQQSRATETTLAKLHSQLMIQWRAAEQAANETPLEKMPQSIIQMAGGDAKLARVIYNKHYLQREFPMRYFDVQAPAGGLPVKQSYNNYVTRAMSNSHNESSVLLYMALREQRRGSGQTPEQYLNSNELKDFFNDGTPEIVDAWGYPIELFLWPTDDQYLNPPELLTGQLRDPLDPDGLLSSGSRSFTLHPVQASMSYLLRPVLASPGRNGQMGLNGNRYMGIQDATAAGDNLYSYRLREFGGRGN